MIDFHCDVWHLCRVSKRHSEGGERKLVVYFFFFLHFIPSGICNTNFFEVCFIKTISQSPLATL